MSKLAIGFWQGREDFGGHYLGHKDGLTKEQVQALKNLREGDKLIVYKNADKMSETSPDISLKIRPAASK